MNRYGMRILNIFILLLVMASILLLNIGTSYASVNTTNVAPASFSNPNDPYGFGYDGFKNFGSAALLSTPYSTGPLYGLDAPGTSSGFDVALHPAAPASGCTRVVNSFSFSVSNFSESNSGGGASPADDFLVGMSTDNSASFSSATSNSEPSMPELIPGMYGTQVNVGVTQIATISFDTPQNYTAAIAAIVSIEAAGDSAFANNAGIWSFNNMSFNVTDTCKDPTTTTTTTTTTVATTTRPAASVLGTTKTATLPKTGISDTDLLLEIALPLVVAGLLLALLARHRRFIYKARL